MQFQCQRVRQKLRRPLRREQLVHQQLALRKHWTCWIYQFRRSAIARYGIHQFRGVAIAWIGSWCPCHNGFATSGVASVALYGVLSGTAEWAETKYTPLPIPTPCQRAGIVTRDAGMGVQRTLSPTAYRPEQLTGITSAWAPQGLGMIRDGNSQFRRIY